MKFNENQKINLLDFDCVGLREHLTELGEKPFRAEQILKWVHQYGHENFAKMSNLSKNLRLFLEGHTCVKAPMLIKEQFSIDGVRKWLLHLEDGNCIETVYIPEPNRGTLCISSQVGCMLNCKFCATAKQGFIRNLTLAEIIGQLWFAARYLSKDDGRHDRQVTNVVLMGMGEPLLNLQNVVKAVNLMMDDVGYGLSKHKVTISTAGIVPQMRILSALSEVSLAVSLHAPNDELRDELIPINKKYPLKKLLAECRRFFCKEPRRKVAFEYVMVKNVNDEIKHARQLLKILEGIPCKVNLIPFNKAADIQYQPSDTETVQRFYDILHRGGINTTVRKTRGADINAACGQLVGKFVQKST